MSGIKYVTDEKGHKVRVLIDLKKRRGLWEDIEDVLVSRLRRHERRIPLERVKAGLVTRAEGSELRRSPLAPQQERGPASGKMTG